MAMRHFIMTNIKITTDVDKHRRVAIIHYWLVGMRGGERVLERLLHLFPQADIFTHVYVPEAMSDVIRARPVYTSFIQRLPGSQVVIIRNIFRLCRWRWRN